MERLNLRQQSARLLLIICLIVASFGYFFWSPGLAAFTGSISDTAQHDIVSQEAAQPIMGDLVPSVMRDPFAVPKEFQQMAPTPALQPQAGNSSVASAVSPPPVIPEMPLELVGVVSGDEQTIAIIKKAGNSHSYQIKEYIGPYQLLAVEESSAILSGPQGKIVLTLER